MHAFPLLLAGLLAAAPAPLLRFDLNKPDMGRWRKKSNCTMVHVPQERGGALRWGAAFGEFNFGWTTRFLRKPADLSRGGRITFWVKGDASGHRLHLQLGVTEKGKPRSTYYPNRADEVAIDFTGWREVAFDMARFAPPRGRDVAKDMQRISFIEFFLTRQGAGATADLMLDDVQVHPATPQQLALLQGLRAMYATVLAGPPARDGSNLLPNASFELDLDSNGEPDFWAPGAWDTGSRPAYDRGAAHSGTASVRVECDTDKQRGSYNFRRTIGPGPWIFEGWYRTEGLAPAPRRGVDARLTVLTAKGKHCCAVHAYGEPTGGEWRRVRKTFDLPPGSARVAVTLFNFFAKGTVWWDDVSLRFDVAAHAKQQERIRIEKQRTLEAQAMIDPIRKEVAELPDSPATQCIKKAALLWCVDDAQAAIDAGLGSQAKGLLEDVRAGAGKAIATRHEPPAGLMPPVPLLDRNPYAQGVLAKAAGLMKGRPRYKKGDAGYEQIKNAWRCRSLGGQAYAAAWAFCHPQSPHAGDPAALTFALSTLQAIFQNHDQGDFNPGREAVHGYDPNINRFTFVPAFEAYLLLRSTYPDLLPASKRAEWEASARVGSQFQYDTYGLGGDTPTGIRYPNMDVHYMLMMELAARMLDEPRYRDEGERFLRGTAECLYPDGAFTYHGHQNECYVYHAINVAHLARYWQLTGNELARELVVKSRPYYPYSVEPGGVPEHYTDCFWKHYWARCSPTGPEIVADITGCPLNKRIANHELQFAKPNSYYAIYAATLYRDFPDKPLPDNYVLYDRNIDGPRGRFGRFSFAGTARLFPSGEQGKDTFAGCMVLDDPSGRYPLNAALQVVTNQYRLAKTPENVEKCRRWRDCRYLSQDEQNAVTIAQGFAALTTRYRIQNVAWGGRSTLTDWAGNQQWLLTRHRVVGVLEIETLSDQQAYSIHGRIRFGTKKAIERRDDTFFKYGGLLCRLHEHNYHDVITEKSETFYIDPPDRFRSTEIVLRDARSVEAKEEVRLTYAKGTRHFFTVEVLPYTSTLSTAVKRIAPENGLRGLEVHADGKRWLLIHNPTDGPLTFDAGAPWARGQVRLHKSGAREPKPEALPGADARRLTIASHTHLVLEAAE